jgi:hypothetical protein
MYMELVRRVEQRASPENEAGHSGMQGGHASTDQTGIKELMKGAFEPGMG